MKTLDDVKIEDLRSPLPLWPVPWPISWFTDSEWKFKGYTPGVEGKWVYITRAQYVKLFQKDIDRGE